MSTNASEVLGFLIIAIWVLLTIGDPDIIDGLIYMTGVKGA